MKKYVDRKWGEAVKFKEGDLVLLSTVDLKFQMVGWQLTKRFIGPYKVKEMVLTNIVK